MDTLKIKKKITVSQLKKYLPIKPPNCSPKLPQNLTRYLLSPSFSNLSITQQNVIRKKYQTVYRNYYGIDDIIKYIGEITQGKYTDNSIKKAICNASEKYGIVNWYKFLRIVMRNQEADPNHQSQNTKPIDKIVLVNQIKQIFKKYLKKRKIWRAVQEVGQTKRSLQPKVLGQLSKQAVKQVKQFIERNRVQCQNVLYDAEKQYPKNVNFVELQKIINSGLQMYLDKKKIIYLYLSFDPSNRGFFKTDELLNQLLVVKKAKPIKKQTYYLTDMEQLLSRIRSQFNQLFYSAHEMQNDFDQFNIKKLQQRQRSKRILRVPDEQQQNNKQNQDEIDPDIFYEYIAQKCQRRYSRYFVDKIHNKLRFRVNLHYIYNKPNLNQLYKLVQKLCEKKRKKRILKKQNQIFYSYRLIILNLITRCKSPKLTKQKLSEFLNDIDSKLKFRSFFTVWRVYPQVINVQRIKRQSKLHPLACYLKLRRTEQQYERIYQDLYEMLPQDSTITINKLEEKINTNLQFVLDITKIVLFEGLDKYDQVNYRDAINNIFQPDFQLYVRSYIHKKVSQKAYAMWRGYKARKQAKAIAQKAAFKMMQKLISQPHSSIDSNLSKKGSKGLISRSSQKTKKQQTHMNQESVQIVKWNIYKLIQDLQLTQKSVKKQFHIDEHERDYLCVIKKQQYIYRTLTPRYVMHPIPGLIGMGQDLMFLNKNRLQTIKLKFFYKPGIEVIDFTTLGNDIIVLTSYFTLEYYSLAQDSNYSYQTILLLDEVKNISLNQLDLLCQDRLHSRFPIFIRNSGKNLFVNTSIVNNQIAIVDSESNCILHKIKFTQKQHFLNVDTIKIIKLLNKSSRKSSLLTEIIKQLSKNQVNINALKKIFFDQIDQLYNQQKLDGMKLTQSQIRGFAKNMQQFNTSLVVCILKQQLNLLKQRKIPASLMQVIKSLIDFMLQHNISLSTILALIDKQDEGFLKMKSLKDYLLKITQQTYIENEKEIDANLRDMVVGKNIQYDIFCQIMSDWKYKIYQRPHLILRDFAVIADANLILYTLQGDNNVYIKNMDDNLLVAVLKGHNCPPSIYFIAQSYIFITGDLDSIRIWRIYEDLIRKYDQNPPWEIFPYATVQKAHEKMITSIIYLTRSHHIVTTSLDSTTKFWRINSRNYNNKQPYLEQVKRFYSDDWVYLSSKSNNILLDNQGARMELLALAKLSKQINQNNKYKYQMKVQVFQVEKTVVKTGPNNIHLQLPPKLKKVLQSYVDSLGVKKCLLLAKKINQIQHQTMKNNLISQNLQKSLYESVKNCFIFQQYSQLYSICQYLTKKNISNQIVRILFQKFGIGIPKSNSYAPVSSIKFKLIRPQQSGHISQQFIQISEDQIQNLLNKLKSVSNNKQISLQQALNVASGYLNVVDFQKFQNILTQFTKSKQNVQKINLDVVLSVFKSYRLNSQLDRLYAILRSVSVLLKQKGLKIWNIFTNNKSELQKKKKINQSQFQNFMRNLEINEQKIHIITLYLAAMKTINIDDYIYYTKLAWEAVGYQINQQSNFSKIFMKNSKFLQSRLDNFKLDSGIIIQPPSQFQQKVLSIQSSIRDNSKSSLGSRKSSRKELKQLQPISESHSAERESGVRQKKKSLNKSDINKQELGMNIVPLSSSNSRVSLSHQSNIKDQFSKQVRIIVKKIKQMMKNEGKSLWDITSLSVPQFMQNNFITESQYFNIFNLIKSPIYLKDKLKLMNYIMRQSDQYNAIDLNIFFQLFESNHQIHRTVLKHQNTNATSNEKYVISYFISKMNENNFTLQHCLQTHFFNETEQLTIQQIINRLSQSPYNMLGFCLKQFENLLLMQNKSAFILQEIKALIEQKVRKYNIKTDSKQVSFIEQIIHQIDNRNMKLQDLLPKSKTNNGLLNFQIFYNMLNSFYHQKQILAQNQYVKIVLHNEQQKKAEQKLKQSPAKLSKMKSNSKKNSQTNKHPNHEQILQKSTIKYKQLINYINKMIQETKKSSSSEKDGVKKFLKALQNKKISLLMFFTSLDRNRNYFINQIQFVAGLAQFKVLENFWPSIKKKFAKRLYYFELIQYLIENEFVSYKCVDSELQAAMSKFVKRFIRNDDIEAVFDRLKAKDSNQPFNVIFSSFQNALKIGNLFKQQQMILIFSAFVNANNLKSSNVSNDNIIKDPTNIHKSFNFKMFTDVVNNFKNQNITKTPHYKLCHFFKKRGISILNQFVKWMERNKKIKQVAEAIKVKQYILPKQLYMNFVKELGAQLQEKQIKQLLAGFPSQLQFTNFNQKLQQIYKKGNSNIQTQQIEAYLQQIYKRIKQLNVTTQRLFQDFTEDKFKMDLNSFGQFIKFLEIGLTKIQIKMIFGYVDLEKKGYITFNQLQNALQQAAENVDKEQQQVQLDFIIQKLLTHKDKYILKASRITYNIDRAMTIFANILSKQEVLLLNKSAQQHYKLNELTQKKIEEFIIDKQREIKAKKDKKYKQLILNFLKYLKKANIDVSEAYFYFSKDTGSLNKNKFLLQYQSLGLKASILQINSLYSYLDQGKTGIITQQKWQDKLNIVQYEKDNIEAASGEQLQVYYKVKLILSDFYLIFVRKLFKSKQIQAYFDINNDGFITYQQLLSSISNLGINLQKNLQDKLINYLDKQRLNKISVKNLVYQLQNCLSSKAKLILSTKTSCIFKQKVHLIQQKQSYFIERLVKSEHFLQSNEKLESCILITDFIDVIRDFGIVLGQDQFSDVQRNFKFNKQNLLLYPMYFMFINIFKSFQNTLTPDQMQRKRHQKLFESLVKNGLNMKIFDKMHTIKQAQMFITQLKIFTPIQVKLLIQSITVPGTNLVDSQLLTRKTRDSFLHTGQWLKSSLMGQLGSDRKSVMVQWLKQQIQPKKVIQILRANSGKISKNKFQQLLVKLGVILKKSDVSQLFNILGNGQDFLLIQNLISRQKNSQKQQKLQIKQQDRYNDIILDHICKSIDFKGVSLQQAWEKYFMNFGFISQESFYQFLDQIGFDYKQKQYEKTVQQFLKKYKKQTKFDDLKTLQIQVIMKRQNHIPQKQCKRQKYFVQSQALQKISQILYTQSQFLKNFELFVQQQGVNVNRISAYIIFGYIKSFLKKFKARLESCITQKQIMFYTNLIINKNQVTLKQFMENTKKFIEDYYRSKNLKNNVYQNEDEKTIMINVPSSSSIRKSSNPRFKTENLSTDQSIKKICQQNFIFSYKNIVSNFQKYISQLNVPVENIYRISLNLVLENLLLNDYLLFIKPKFTISNTEQTKKVKKIDNSEKGTLKFNMKTVANLIIQKEQFIAQKNIYKVNQKYYGMNVSQKSNFQTFAMVANLLDDTIVFLRAKNYYLWLPNEDILPKQAVNFRWKFIPIVLLKLAKQFSQLELNGFALPHLRWQHINSAKGINNVPFPSHAGSLGRLQSITHENLLKLDDPYSAPQIFKRKDSLTLKINSWILGCLMYQFFWGHSPNSFIVLLLEYIENRHSQYQLADVLKMQQLPSDFRYTPFRFNLIKQTIAFEHQLKSNSVLDDLQNNIIYFGMRGLVKSLQIIYGNQYMYYKKQFQIFQKIHQLIIDCLDPNPQTRLSINSIVERLSGLLQEEDYRNFQYSQYIQVLKSHQSVQKLNNGLIKDIKQSYNKSKFSLLQKLSSQYYQQLKRINRSKSVRQIYAIPKRYPWPTSEQQQQVYQRQLLANKSVIRQHGSYSTICSLENQKCLEKLINTFVRFSRQSNLSQDSLQVIFNNLMNSILVVFQMLRSYNNPFCGYVSSILQSFIQLIYRHPYYFKSNMCNDQGSDKGKLLTIKSNGIFQKRALNILKNIIYLDGNANIQYLPINHFLSSRKQFKLLYQYFYCSFDLIYGQKDEVTDRRVLSINYFRDRIYDEYFWEIIEYLKIDVLMLKLLQQKELTMHILLFFKDITSSSNCLKLPLIYSNVLYLKLGVILSHSLVSIQIKQYIIEICSNILRLNDQRLVKKMNQPSFGLIKQIFKLLIQPDRQTPLHQQYLVLNSALTEFVDCFKQVSKSNRLLDQLEGGQTILKQFQNTSIVLLNQSQVID